MNDKVYDYKYCSLCKGKLEARRIKPDMEVIFTNRGYYWCQTCDTAPSKDGKTVDGAL